MKTKYGFYKVGTGNFIVNVGNINKNKEEIIKLIKEAKKENLTVLVFPELSLNGYTSSDLFDHDELFNKTLEAIKEIKEEVDDNLLVFIGGIFKYLNRTFNVSYCLNNKKIIGIVPKTYLPNYNEFYEKRWFNSSKDAFFDEVKINNEVIPFGTDLIFDGDEIKISAEICEDLWVINPPSNNYSLNGANVIVNLSASNEIIGKKEYRESLVKSQSERLYSAYIYSSSGFGESSQDLIYSGHQLIFEEGKKVAESYDKKGLTVGLIDLNKINNDRNKFKTSFEGEITKKCRYIEVLKDKTNDLLPKEVDKYPFLVKNEQKRIERSKEIIALQAKGLATRLYNTKFNKVVIGVSGGLDSTLALLVINEAYKMLNLDKNNIFAISLPGFATSSNTFNNAKDLIIKLGLNYKEIDIKDSSSSVLKALNHKEDVYDLAYENTQARMRTLLLMNYANMENALVIGTGDLSEAALGFSTYNGDHMSMYNVNSSIPKSLVKTIVNDYKYIDPSLEEVLTKIIETPISPELVPFKNGKMQETENIIGKYDLHDFFLYQFIRNEFNKEKIFELAKIAYNDIDESYIKDTLNLFMKRFFNNQFKRSCMPDTIKIGSVSLSPRGDLRLPSDLSFLNSINDKEL